MDKITRKIYCYDFLGEYDLKKVFDDYNSKLNKNYKNLQERKLIYKSNTDDFKYFLDIYNKIYVKNENSDPRHKINCYYECILYKLRESDFPYLFDLATGNKDKINAKISQALMEQTHFIVIPEINLIISEYNHQGAKIGKLISVIHNSMGLKYASGMKINNIFNAHTIERIRNLGRVKTMTFKAGHQGIKTLSDTIDIGGLDSLNNTFDNSSELEFEITIKGKGKSKEIKKGSNESLKSKIENLFQLIKNSRKEDNNIGIKKAKIQETDSDDKFPIDLLEENLVSEIVVTKLNDKFKYLNSKDMFEELFKVYNYNRFKLDRYERLIISDKTYNNRNMQVAF